MQPSSDPGSFLARVASDPNQISPEDRSDGSVSLPRAADWLVYAGIALCGLMTALVGAYKVEADTVAYLDLSSAVKDHHWQAVFNASWFPLYPAFITIGKGFFGYRQQYELMAARLVDFILGLLFVLSSVALAAAIRRLMLARGIKAAALLPPRTLYLLVAILAYFFLSQDMTGIKPDALVSSFMLLTVAALLWGIANSNLASFASLAPFAMAGLFGALAFWTKAFAFPFFFLWLFLAAAVNLRRPRILVHLLTTLAVFALIAGPYIWQISAAKGRFTIGDSGRLNTAWYVNGADRFNPVNDFSIYHAGEARIRFKHPGELLSRDPEISYYSGDQVYGSTPQWDDFSYWSDGTTSRFVLSQTIATLKRNLIALALILPMRLQALVLLAALSLWGFTVRRAMLPDPILFMVFLLAILSILSFLLVHLEPRYVAFTFVLIGTCYAACAVTTQPSGSHRSLHAAVLLMSALLLLFALQTRLREWKQAQAEGARPLQGIYNLSVYSAATGLAALYPRGTEVACMGDAACWADTVWAEYAGLKMTAIIETGRGDATLSAQQGCEKLERNPVGLDLLRQRHVQVIVAKFEGEVPCSTQWQPLAGSGNYFYRPL